MTVEDIVVDGSSPEGGVISVWTLNRPDKLNALNAESHRAIKEASARANSDDSVRCVVIKGAPPPEAESSSMSSGGAASPGFSKYGARARARPGRRHGDGLATGVGVPTHLLEHFPGPQQQTGSAVDFISG